MKILSVLLLIATAMIFTSCNSDSPVAPPSTGGYQWNLVGSLPGSDFARLSACDENTVIAGGYQVGYKISSGTLSTIYFQDSTFNSDCSAAFNANYYAFCGTTFNSGFTGVIRMKIFDHNNLINAVLDTHNSGRITDMMVISNEKIAAITSSMLYIYDHGIVTSYPGLDSFSTNFNNLTASGNTLYISGGNRKIYKFENNALSVVYNESGSTEYARMKVDNAIIKAPYSPLPVTASYWAGSAWNTLFTDPGFNLYLTSSGENINSIYFIVTDSTLSRTYGKIWNGSQLSSDPNYPPDDPSSNIYIRAISNMRSNTIFISKSESFSSKIYRGRKN